jgi:hypothetical protein
LFTHFFVKGYCQKSAQISRFLRTNFKISTQISTFDRKVQFSLPVCSTGCKNYLEMKISEISDFLRLFADFCNKAMKSYKQKKSSSTKKHKFQHCLPYD